MATMSKRTNPINIAPFVDILLILFVILIVAARFTQDSEVKQQEPVSKIEELEKMLSNKEDAIKSLSKDIDSLREAVVSPKKENTELQSKNKEINAIKKEVEKLKQENKRLKDRGLNINIDSYGGVYLNGSNKKISPEAVIDIINATDSGIVKSQYSKTPEAANIWNYILKNINSPELNRKETGK